jgi:K(+)-stimulated pyrophosphate-energized sodium pump
MDDSAASGRAVRTQEDNVGFPVIAAEGGYQEFVLRGGEMAVLAFSGAAALLAIAVGFVLMRGVLAADQGTPTMIKIAGAIQEGASAYLRRQFRTIAVILIPLGA